MVREHRVESVQVLHDQTIPEMSLEFGDIPWAYCGCIVGVVWTHFSPSSSLTYLPGYRVSYYGTGHLVHRPGGEKLV